MLVFSFPELVERCQTWTPKRPGYAVCPLDHHNPELASSLYRIEPGQANYPHYHHRGDDIFLIVSGVGELITCPMTPPADSVAATALTRTPVETGSYVHVDAQCLHWLRNLSPDQPLYYLNIAPLSHESDRVDVTIEGWNPKST
ncbi:MAG: cupin [Thermosynechococcus sp.]|uniref:cupin domain-containing protein n=1 Tax=Thermosynechococcus sp. TaxID=2814275 RepID=UPI002207AA53|nr:cupin domain-containing protein [Thermosynechococcus sp.]BCX11294.1 MAG: cupin [Thermosynechococcus sp.]